MKIFGYKLMTAILLAAPCAAYAGDLTGQFVGTGNLSTQTQLMPSLNTRVTANYALSTVKSNLDLRLERYTENSYHTADASMTRERKAEVQLNFNLPLTEHFTATVGALRHENYTFRDNYNWTVAGVSWSGDVVEDLRITAGVLAEKRNGRGRPFYDFAVSAEHRFRQNFGAFAVAHIYENLGEFDSSPSRKREFETGINYDFSKRYFAGISYFYHQQVGDPSDRFSFLKLKIGVNF